MPKITLTVACPGGTPPRSSLTHPNLSLDALGLLAVLAATGKVDHDLTQVAAERFYDTQCLRVIADELDAAGYAHVADGGDA